ncbi:MAG: MATE family efflux transporter [Azospirillaceae bacterium]
MSLITAERFGSADWHRRVWRLALPIMAANVSTPLLGAVDTAVVGHLPEPHYLGSVAVGAMVFSFLFWGFSFLRMGTTGPTAQALGRGDDDEVRAILGRALILAVVIGLALIALREPLRWAALAAFDASPAVEGEAAGYIALRLWGAPATLGNYVLIGWLLGLQRPMWTLALQIALNATNIALDLLFVPVMGLGVPGVAIASALAEWTAFALGLFLAARVLKAHGGAWSRARLLDRAAFRRLVALNADIMIRTLCLIGAFAVFTNQGARFGDRILAANAVLWQLQMFTSFALDGFAHAAETLVGGTIGRRRRAELAQAVRASTVWAALVSTGFVAAYLMAGPAIIDLLTGIPEVRATARTYLPWAAALPVLSVWSFQLDGIFLGATWSKAIRNAMLASVAIYLAALFLAVPAMDNHGLWLALAIFMVARGATLAAAYPALARAV